jgi:hypothetical protein
MVSKSAAQFVKVLRTGVLSRIHASVPQFRSPKAEIKSWQALDIPIVGRSTIAIHYSREQLISKREHP